MRQQCHYHIVQSEESKVHDSEETAQVPHPGPGIEGISTANVPSSFTQHPYARLL
jgi:hypothetical protein